MNASQLGLPSIWVLGELEFRSGIGGRCVLENNLWFQIGGRRHPRGHYIVR